MWASSPPPTILIALTRSILFPSFYLHTCIQPIKLSWHPGNLMYLDVLGPQSQLLHEPMEEEKGRFQSVYPGSIRDLGPRGTSRLQNLGPGQIAHHRGKIVFKTHKAQTWEKILILKSRPPSGSTRSQPPVPIQ